MRWTSLFARNPEGSAARREGEQRSWPGYLFGGRMRVSTVGLVVGFILTWWLYSANLPEPAPTPEAPATQVVPPGFVPDPEYTWVPRTNVQETPRLTTTTTTPTTTTTEPTDTTDPSATTTGPAPTSFNDPDGIGPLPPTPVTETTDAPSTAPGPQPSTTSATPQG